jgi:tetratricopeptide (TPR) repeat protein
MTEVSDLIKQGLARDNAGRHDEAARIYQQVLRLEPGHVDAMHLLGLALLDLGEIRAGRESLERAVTARPNHPIYCYNYATIASEFGELDVAETWFRRAIAAKPGSAEAYYGLVTAIKATSGDPLLEDIERLLDDPGLETRDRAHLHFAAGKLADDLDEPDRAFRHFERGNQAAGRTFDRSAHAAAMADQLRVFTSGFFEARKGGGSNSEAMVFVVGMPRSGTTLVEQIIGSHPLAYAAGERQDISVIAGILPKQYPQGRRFPDCVGHIDKQVFGAFADRYVKILTGKASEAVRFVDKNPLNYSYLGLIALMFPKARIVHCRRDPIDTSLSCYFQYCPRHIDFSFDLGDIAAAYGDYRALMDHWRAHLPLPILDVDYESVVADPVAESRRLIEFCGLPWDEACLNFQAGGRPVKTASKWQVRQPIYRTSVARADKYAAHLGPLRTALAPYSSQR